MAKKYRRYSLKSRDTKQVLSKVSEKLKIDLETVARPKVNIEIVEADTGQLILVDGRPLLFKVGEAIFPTLLFKEFVERAPKIVVDMGAVPYVCKGADVMAPGIVRFEGEFGKGDLVVVVDLKHGKPLAIGESLRESGEAKPSKQGPVVKNLHFVSDKIWNLSKTFHHVV
jgi:PUA domain protein